MAFFIFFVLFVFPFLQAGPLDNWVSFLAWAIFIIIPLTVTVLLCITTAHEDDNDSKKLNLNVQVKGGVSDDRRRHCTLR